MNKYFAVFLTIFAIFLSGCDPLEVKEEVSISGSEKPYKPAPLSEYQGSNNVRQKLSYPQYAKTVKVALLLPLSGKHGSIGQSMLDAANRALFDKFSSVNPELVTSNVVIMPIDTYATVNGTIEAARQAVNQDADVILGPLFSRAIPAIAPIARQNNIPILTFSNNKDVAGKGVYTLGFLPEHQISRVVQYSIEQDKYNISALAPNNSYGAKIAQSLQQELSNSDKGNLIKLELYSPSRANPVKEIYRLSSLYNTLGFGGQNNEGEEQNPAIPSDAVQIEPLAYEINNKEYDTVLRPVNEDEELAKDEIEEYQRQAQLRMQGKEPRMPFDSLLIPQGGKILIEIAKLMEENDLIDGKLQILGSAQWDDVELLNIKPLKGAWFASTTPLSIESYERHFFNSYGYKPPRITSLAYDSVALITTLALSPEVQRIDSTVLENPIGFRGPIDGIFRFTESGIVERGLAILEIGEERFNVIDPAPESFITDDDISSSEEVAPNI